MGISNDSKSLPEVYSNGFKKLPWKDQLYIISLYLRDRDKYRELAGLYTDDSSLAYLDTLIGKIRTEVLPVPDVSDEKFAIVENHFAGYYINYKDNWYSSPPLDILCIRNIKLFSYFQLFDFPLVTYDKVSQRLLKWLVEKTDLTRNALDLIFYWFRMRVVVEYFASYLLELPNKDSVWKDVNFKSLLNESNVDLDSCLTVRDLNESWPLMYNDDDEVLELIDNGTYVVWNKPKFASGKFFTPLIPVDLYSILSFRVNNWGFLV